MKIEALERLISGCIGRVAQLNPGAFMRSIAIAAAVAFTISGAAYGQTRSPGGSAAKQDVGDPLIRKPTSQDKVRGTTTGRSTQNQGGSRGQIGGTPESQQSTGSNGGQ